MGVLTHSLWAFFFPCFGIKKQEKFAGHSFNRETVNLQKKVKNGKKWHLLSNFSFFRCFFSQKPPKVFFFSFVFFSWKSLHSTHSLIFRQRKKKNSTGKKKTPFSITHSIFAHKCSKINFSGEIKKIRYL